MDVETTAHKRCSVVTVSGRVDSNTAPKFEETLKKVIEGHKETKAQKNVVLELSGVEFMSSAGLRGMVSSLKACKSGGGDLRLATPSARVVEVMQLAGLTSLFQVFDDKTAAVGSF
jgi:anti-sigma B factor antagonist